MASFEERMTALENRSFQAQGNQLIPPADTNQERIPKKKARTREPTDDDNWDDKSVISLDQSFTKVDSSAEIRAILGLLFAHVDQDDPSKVVLGTLKPDIETLFAKKNFNAHWDRLHGHAKKKHTDENAHFLASCLSDDFQVHPALLKRLVTGQIHHNPLANLFSKDVLRNDVFLMHFASPTTEWEQHEHLQYSRQTREEGDNELFNQPSIHRVRKDTTLHIFLSFCDNVENILATIANFMIVAGTLVVVPEWGTSAYNPSIINYFHDLANLFTKADARNRIAVLSKQPQFRHLLFSIFCCFQDILGSFGNIIRNSDLVSQVLSNPSTDDIDFSIYRNTVKEFHSSKKALELLVLRSQTSAFVSAPMSFSIIFPPKAKDETNKGKDYTIQDSNRFKRNGKDGKPYPKSESKGDWLLHIDRTKKLTTFSFADCNIGLFCLCFATKDYNCKWGSSCKNPHIDYASLADNKKEALKAYLASNNTFKLAE